MQRALSKVGVSFLLLLVVIPYATASTITKPPSAVYSGTPSFSLPAPPIVSSASQLSPVSGVLKVLVIAVTFSDISNSTSITQIKQSWSQVNQYYKEASYGTVSLQIDVFGWYHLPNPEVYYGRDCLGIDDADCSGYDTAWWIARDAVQLAQNDVNFNNYDYYAFVHSGNGQESSGVKNDVWSVTFLGGVSVQAGGKTLDRFSVDPESEARGGVPMGVYAHEFGHQLGLPDMYDTQTGQTIMGPWTLMDAGLWNGNPPGSSPAHLDSWCKTQLGWISGPLLAVSNSASNYTIDPSEVPTSNVHAVQVPVSHSASKYYLVEVRQQIGFDSALPSVGVLILYVDESLGNGKVHVMDANPSIGGLTKATWSVGQTFTDSLNNVTIAVVGKVGTSYQIRVGQSGVNPPPPNQTYIQLSIAKIFSTPNVITLPNTTITIFIDITNQGTQSATNVLIEIDLDAQQYTTATVNVNAGSTVETYFVWKSTVGTHTFKVTVDPFNAISEPSKAGHVSTFTLSVGPTLTINVPVNVTSSGANVWVKINGVQYNLTSSHMQISVPSGTVTVQIEPGVNTSQGVRQAFSGWLDGYSSNPRQLVIINSTQLTALFRTQYLLTVNANQGTTSPSGWYNASSIALVSASATSNQVANVTRLAFMNWSGGVNSTSISLSINMTKPVSVSANWIRQYYVSILSQTGSPTGAGWYNAGSTANISVQPIVQFSNSTREVFTGWNVTRLVQAPSFQFNVSSPTRLQAILKFQYLMQITSSYGSPSGSGWYDVGSPAQVSIQSQINYNNRTRRVLTGWTGDYYGPASNFTATVNKPMSVQAQWKTQYQITFKVSGIPNSTQVTLNVNNSSYVAAVNQPYSAWYDKGQALNPTANQTVMGFFQFVDWRNSTGGSVAKPIMVNAPQDYSATYTATLPLGIPGFPVESVLIGLTVGVLTVNLARKRRRKSK